VEEGERVLRDRLAQKNFEKRRVLKHIISSKATSSHTISEASSSSDATTSLLSFDSTGKLCTSSQDKIVCFEEGHSFTTLNLAFSLFDTSGKGYLEESDIVECKKSNPFLSALCSDGNIDSDASLRELYRTILLASDSGDTEGSDRIYWKDFTNFFRPSSCGRSSNSEAWYNELWACALTLEEKVALTRVFELYSNDDDDLLLTQSDAVRAMLELSQDFDAQISEDQIRDAVESKRH
jgi:hypothetical protein